MKKMFWLILCLPVFVCAQTPQTKKQINSKGISFNTRLSWLEVIAKAKAENKYIFMDCYTTWCAPCRWMEQNIFPRKEVGDYMNAHFISIKVQMDKTDKDVEQIKKWYQDAYNISQQYEIKAFPTSLFFTPNGQIVHRTEGSRTTAAAFLKDARAAFDSNKAYYRQLATYMSHKYLWKDRLSDSAYLYSALDSARKFRDVDNLFSIADAYIKNVTSPLVPRNLDVIQNFTTSIRDRYFPLLLNNVPKIAAILKIDSSKINNKLKSIIAKDELIPKLYNQSGEVLPTDWEGLEKQLHMKYPAFADELLCEYKMNYYKSAKDIILWEKSVAIYMNKYGKLKGNGAINNRAWDVFCNSHNPTLLKEAVGWMEPIAAQYGTPELGDWEHLDTYANLLYKTGDVQGAILWEKRAIEFELKVGHDQAPGQRKEFEATLAKMKKGEKTWKD